MRRGRAKRLEEIAATQTKVIKSSAVVNSSTKNDNASAVIICCSALMRDILSVCKANNWTHLDVQCISAEVHNYPQRITGEVKALIDVAKAKQQQIFVAFADCGTGGLLDVLVEAEQVERISGAHCYEFYAGSEQFEQLQEAELGTFYLTDFLVRHFERLIIRGLGIDQKPELLSLYFGNYRKLMYLSQCEDKKLQSAAVIAAKRLNLEYEYQYTGTNGLSVPLTKFNNKIAVQLV
ncbi:MAG: DUF1638 domain-containing protein [Oceanospirillaceae bacterium]